MATSIYPRYPPEIKSEQSEYLVSNLKDWSIAHGLAVRPPPSFVGSSTDPHGVLASTAPVTLFPSLFPRSCFEEARAIQTAYNELYAAISSDEEWLNEIVKEIVEVDNFIAQLWNVHLSVKKEGYVQDLSLGIFRSDYMAHVDPSGPRSRPEIKQVEFNTIASSFAGLADRVSQLHKHLLSISAYPSNPLFTSSALPQNESITSIAGGLAASHLSYGPSISTPPLPLCVVIIVQDPERNVFDQRHLEYALQSEHQIPIYRLPFAQVLSQVRVGPTPLRPLIYEPPHLNAAYEVTTVYFRAGYSPDDYASPSAWSARLLLERSAAIKCPSILTHLAGCKKVQQVLATPSSPYLSRFLSSSSNENESRVRQTFTNIYPLDATSPAGQHARRLALDPVTAQHYVLKPQREGGGNNVYRRAIPPFLKSIPEANWKGYVLMEIIEPPALENSIFRNGDLVTGGVIGELGVYGVCLWRSGKSKGHDSGEGNEDGGVTARDKKEGEKKVTTTTHGEDRKNETVASKPEIIKNWQAGYLLRTKGHESEEGGVAAGFGCMDSCLLVDV